MIISIGYCKEPLKQIFCMLALHQNKAFLPLFACHSDKGLRHETSALATLYSDHFTLSSWLIKQSYSWFYLLCKYDVISLISSQPKNLGMGLWQDSLKFVIKITTEDLKHIKNLSCLWLRSVSQLVSTTSSH